MPFTTPAAGHRPLAALHTTHPRLVHSPLGLAIATALALAAAGVDTAAADSCALTAGGGTLSTWNVAGNGNWSVAGDWTASTVPNSSVANVCITNGTSTVTLDNVFNVGSLQVGSGNTLTFAGGSELTVAGPQLIDNGAINVIGGGGTNTVLQITGNTTLSGTGTLTLGTVGGAGTAYLQQSAGNQTLTNTSTIQGTGTVGNGGLTLVNSGTINANVTGQVLTVNPGNANSAGVLNNTGGLLTATGGGVLQILSQTITNTSGNVTASGTGSTVNLQNTTVNGGNLTAASGGVLQTVGTATLNGVTVSGNYLSDTGATTTLSGTFSHSGNLQVNGGGGNNGILDIGGATTLTGGTTTLSYLGAGGAAYIQQSGGNQLLTNAETIQGAGTVGNGGLTLVNSATGVINANVTGQALTINPGNALDLGGQLQNQGVIEATNGGTLLLASQNVVNAGRTISAVGTGSVLDVQNTTINGGTLAVSGGGTMQTLSTATLSGVTLSGNYLSDSGTTTTLTGTISHSGNLQVNGGGGNNGILYIGGATTLTGGTTTLGNLGASGTAYIQQSGGSQLLTNAETIQGTGILGNGGLTLVNSASGIVNANVSGQVLTLNAGNALDSGGQLQNQGVLEATNGGTLALVSENVANAGRTISAVGAGSALNLQNTTINGGTLAVSGGGTMQTLSTATLNGVTLSGNYLSDLGTTTTITGTLNHSGVLTINAGGGNNTILYIGGAATLTGGTTTLAYNGTGSGQAFIQQSGGNQLLTNAETIQGTGIIGNGGLTFVNSASGIVNANVSGQVLTLDAGNTLDAGAQLQNQGVLEATNGGRLALVSENVANAGRTISAVGAGSALNLQNTTINGGTLAVSGGGTMQTISAATLNGVTLSGNYLSDVGTTTTLTGTISHSGALTINAGSGNNTILYIGGATTLTGGTTTLAYNGTGSGQAFIQQSGASQTLINAETIHGTGTIGNGGLTLTNNGTVNADVAGQTLTISTNNANNAGLLANNGLLTATNGATMLFAGQSVANAGQGITASGIGSLVGLQNTTVNGGNLTATGGGLIQTLSSATLNGVTIAGNYLADLNTTTTLNGTVTNNGAVQVNAGSGNNTLVYVAGTTTLAGSGTLTLSNTGGAGSVYIQQAGGNQLLTNASTIQGTGVIGNGGLTLVNAAGGTINANVAGQGLTLSPNGALDSQSGIANSGLLVASAGTLIITPTVYGNGTIQTSGTGVVTLGAASSAGTLINNGTTAGAALVLGANSVTVSGDYQNANFGVGNAFDKTANVSATTGQILAAGNVATALTGANVTNGTGPTATLTIGNVHANTTTSYGFQVANTGTTGPAIRGAIQTAAGGGVITDGSLSVAAQNFGPIAAGASSGTIGVTYTAGGAGLLSTLSGTNTLHIANNFQNVAEQNLDIVIGSGAAAYNLAAGSAGAVTLANQRVGGAGTGTVAVTNSAPAGVYTEALNAAFTGSSGAVTSITGSISGGTGSGVAGGATNSSAMTVGIDTSTFGAKTGTATLAYVSNGTGSSGLGNTAVGSQTVSVAGNVYEIAQITGLPTAVNVGNVHVGSTGSAALSISNPNVAPGFQEGLNVTVGTGTGGATGSGSITNLAAGGSSSAVSAALLVGGAGAQSGTVALNLASNGTGTSGLSTLSLGSQNVTVTGTGYNLAAGSAANAAVANQRVGGGNTTGIAVTNTAAAGAFTEALNASVSGSAGQVVGATGAIAGGTGSGLAGQATNATAITAGVDTTSSGAKTGTVTLAYASNGTGSSGLGTTTLSTQNVTISGNVYQLAAGQLNNTAQNPNVLNFGTVQVGQAVSGALSVSNIATGAAGYVEDLNTRFGSTSGTGAGQITGTGQIVGLAAGSTNNTAMTVSVNTSAAGSIAGAIGVNFYSAGTVNGTSNGLGELAVGSASYGVNGTIQTTGQIVNQASPLINNAQPIILGNVRVGASSPTAIVSITNQATTAPQAALDASITGNAPITASGSFALLGPGATDATSLTVGMNTASAGAKTGTATVALTSDAGNIGGCGTNCLLTLAPQNVSVQGGVYNVAQPTIASVTNLGNVHVGSTASGTIGVTNTNISPAGYQEGLNVAVNSTSGATASGSLTNLAAGSFGTIGTSLAVGSAGVQSGTVSLGLASNGAGTSGLATLALGTQVVTVNATGYNLAAGSAIDVTVAAQRVGGANAAGIAVTNTAAPGAYTEVLNASVAGTGGQATGATGAIAGGTGSGLAGGATNSSAITVGVDTTSSGAKTGTVTLAYVSNGTGSSGLGNTALGTQTVNVSGNVYQTALATLNTPTPVNFGIVHVGDTVTQAVSVTNAASGTLNDVLLATASGGTGGATASGNLGSGLAAGATSSALSVGLNTSTAGIYNGGTATFTAASHNAEMADAALAAIQVGVTGQVNNYAKPEFALGSGAGTLTNTGLAYTLNLGTVAAGSSVTDALSVLNNVAGPSDLVEGTFTLTGATPNGLTLGGFDFGNQAFGGLGAGESYDLLSVAFDASQFGPPGTSFADTIDLTAVGYNASGYTEQFAMTLTIDGTVQSTSSVPEPDSLWLALMGFGLIGGASLVRRSRGGVRAQA